MEDKKELQYWFNKGVTIGYHSALNDEQLSWLKLRNELFEKLFEIKYPKKVCDHEWYENSNGGAQCILCESYTKHIMDKFRLKRLKYILKEISNLDFWISLDELDGKHSKEILSGLKYLQKALKNN